MPRYAVLLHGRNLLLLSEGQLRSGGVYAWRCVEAEDESAAVSLAILKLHRDQHYQKDVWNTTDSPPTIEAEQIDVLDPEVSLEDGDSACVFYVDEEDVDLAGRAKDDALRESSSRREDE
jgi:hypothetical protein